MPLVQAHALGARCRRDLRRQRVRRFCDRALAFGQRLGLLAASVLDRLGDEQFEGFAFVFVVDRER